MAPPTLAPADQQLLEEPECGLILPVVPPQLRHPSAQPSLGSHYEDLAPASLLQLSPKTSMGWGLIRQSLGLS